jgi:proline iminopeptidase
MTTESTVATRLALMGCIAISSADAAADENHKPTVITPPLVYKLEHDLQSVLFPEIEPFDEGFLQVSELHRIWYAQYGNPSAIPVVVLHGGPGFGCSPRDMRFFDPSFYRIVLLDQRGAGRSLPHASLEENTTPHLIADLEKLRTHLGIDAWVLFGGSFGSALALAYGESHPERNLGFILRGVFLGTKSEYIQLWYGMGDIYPEAFEEMSHFIPADERDDLIAAYQSRINNPDPKVHLPAALAFMKYDLTAAFALQSPFIEQMLQNQKMMLSTARIFTHYCTHHFFFEPDQLLAKLATISHLPAFIVHGRFDAICRAKTAYHLAKNWPGSRLTFVQDAGHSAAEPGIAKALVDATETFRRNYLGADPCFENPK